MCKYDPEHSDMYIKFMDMPRGEKPSPIDTWEIIYIYEGHGNISRSGSIEEISADSFVIAKPGAVYSVASSGDRYDAPARACKIVFNDECFNDIKDEIISIFSSGSMALCDILLERMPACVIIPDDDAHNIHNILWLIAHEYNHFKIGSRTVIRNSLINFFICAARLYEYSLNSIPPTIRTNPSLEELKKYMQKNFSYSLTLDFLASQVHLSREHLSRVFKKYTGQTITEYLREIRISRAKQLLHDPKISITDISAYCGYNTIDNFQRAFKKLTGMSPREYRKRFR